MKVKKNLLTFTVAGLMAFLFCLPVAEVMAGGNNPPGGEVEYKQMGPKVKGQLIVGWRYDYAEEVDYGDVEANILVEGKLHTAIIKSDVIEDTFLALEAVDILEWLFPTEIADEYNMPLNTKVVVLEEKDVIDFQMLPDREPPTIYTDPNSNLTHKHVFLSKVKISFLVPK